MTAAAATDTTKLVESKAPTQTKLIKMHVNLPLRLRNSSEPAGFEKIHTFGEIIEVEEDEARELEKISVGGYSVSGEVSYESAEASRYKYKKASRV